MSKYGWLFVLQIIFYINIVWSYNKSCNNCSNLTSYCNTISLQIEVATLNLGELFLELGFTLPTNEPINNTFSLNELFDDQTYNLLAKPNEYWWITNKYLRIQLNSKEFINIGDEIYTKNTDKIYFKCNQESILMQSVSMLYENGTSLDDYKNNVYELNEQYIHEYIPDILDIDQVLVINLTNSTLRSHWITNYCLKCQFKWQIWDENGNKMDEIYGPILAIDVRM